MAAKTKHSILTRSVTAVVRSPASWIRRDTSGNRTDVWHSKLREPLPPPGLSTIIILTPNPLPPPRDVESQ